MEDCKIKQMTENEKNLNMASPLLSWEFSRSHIVGSNFLSFGSFPFEKFHKAKLSIPKANFSSVQIVLCPLSFGSFHIFQIFHKWRSLGWSLLFWCVHPWGSLQSLAIPFSMFCTRLSSPLSTEILLRICSRRIFYFVKQGARQVVFP